MQHVRIILIPEDKCTSSLDKSIKVIFISESRLLVRGFLLGIFRMRLKKTSF